MLGIHHNLLAIKGSSLGGITEAYSHPHALNQCKSFLKKHHIRPSVAYDTAGSAMRVSQKKDNTKAAIASKLCAKIYDLDIIKENIESNKTNTTRFFVVVNEGDQSVVSADKTSIAFKTRHYPGALADCLKAFQLHKLNLTKLESRPIPENPFEYVFYTDFEGGINDSVVIHAIKILENHSEFVKVLGDRKSVV